MSDPLRLKNPIVLVHGLGARSTYGPVDYFHGLPRRLREAGNEVFIANLPSWQTVGNRAEILKGQIEQAFPGDRKVNLLGHSMGGLDSRYLVSSLGFEDRVASVTTIGTPHRGSVMGDVAAGLVPEIAFAGMELLMASMGLSPRGLQQISSQFIQTEMAAKMQDSPKVAYFSATSYIPDPVMRSSLPLFWLPHRVLKKYEGDNDGFVSVKSATWGTHICTYRGDHYAQIGQFLGMARGMDYVSFFDEIITRLGKEGF